MNTPETAFIIFDQGVVKAEYKIIDNLIGNTEYVLTKQSLSIKNNTYIDQLDISTSEGKKFSFYFDISASF